MYIICISVNTLIFELLVDFISISINQYMITILSLTTHCYYCFQSDSLRTTWQYLMPTKCNRKARRSSELWGYQKHQRLHHQTSETSRTSFLHQLHWASSDQHLRANLEWRTLYKLGIKHTSPFTNQSLSHKSFHFTNIDALVIKLAMEIATYFYIHVCPVVDDSPLTFPVPSLMTTAQGAFFCRASAERWSWRRTAHIWWGTPCEGWVDLPTWSFHSHGGTPWSLDGYC